MEGFIYKVGNCEFNNAKDFLEIEEVANYLNSIDEGDIKEWLDGLDDEQDPCSVCNDPDSYYAICDIYASFSEELQEVHLNVDEDYLIDTYDNDKYIIIKIRVGHCSSCNNWWIDEIEGFIY